MNAPMGLDTVATAGAGLNFRLQRAMRARQISQIKRKLAEKRGASTGAVVDVTGRERVAQALHSRLAGKLANMRAAGNFDDANLGSWDVVGVVSKLKKRLKTKPKAIGTKTAPKKNLSAAKVVRAKAVLKKLSPLQKKAVIRKAIAKAPALRKKLAVSLVRNRLAARTEQLASPGAYSALTPVPARDSSPPPAGAPASPSIPEESARSSADVVEDEMTESDLDRGADAEAQSQDAVKDAEGDVQTDLEVEAAAEDAAMDEAEPLTEPDAEDVDEEAEEDVNDAMEAATSGSFLKHLSSASLQARKARKVAKGKARLKAAVGVAKAVETSSDGKIKATDTMKAAAIITAAKAGDTNSKAAIVNVVKKAQAGDPKAKKTKAQLKVANAVLNKSKPGGPPKPRARTAKPSGGTWYSRGLAMIPTTASYFRMPFGLDRRK